jgi:hypothetical protein
MRVGVGERAETVIVFLARSIPKGQLDVFAIDLDIGDVVLKDGGDVYLHGQWCQSRCNKERWARGS